MAIKEIDDFTVAKTQDRSDGSPRLWLAHRNHQKPLEASGKVLEAQYRLDGRYLLLVTEGNPYEESLYIYLVDDGLQTLDALELSAMYAEGMVHNLRIADTNKLSFSFFSKEDSWMLEIYRHPEFSLMNTRYPVKRRMPMFTKGWLSLEKYGRPQ